MTHVCADCAVAMRCEKNDITVESTSGDFGALYRADLWRCPQCDHRIVTGFGRCFGNSYEPGYAELRGGEDVRVVVTS